MSCGRCGGRSIGKLESLPDAATMPSYRAVGTIIGELEAAILSDSGKGVSHYGKWDAQLKAGTIEARVCTSCGCIDLYVQDPQWVPFSRLEGFRVLSIHRFLESARFLSDEEKTMWANGCCPMCTSDETGKLSTLPDTVGKETETRSQMLGLNEKGDPVGNVEALVCTKCGYLQLVVQQPRSLDFERLQGFSWLSRAKSGPYR